jgi:hypothetical protein
MRLLLLSTLLLGACADDRPPSLTAHLRECELLSEGFIRDFPLYAPDDCYARCLGAATCTELEAALCGTSIDLLRQCDHQCAHRCPDGSLIAVEAVCDGVEQCPSGEDETNCTTFQCADGSAVAVAARCDGSWTCPDGSDEIDCPTFVCRDGMEIRETLVCNGYDNCLDGADEQGCPVFRCDDGTEIWVGFACDGWAQCSDGSDESRCADVVATCE